MLQHQSHRSLPNRCWISAPSGHRSILSKGGASNFPGAVQTPWESTARSLMTPGVGGMVQALELPGLGLRKNP